MSEFQCKCERAWFYAFHSTGCPDCGATQPYYMDGMNRANVDTVVACYEDAMGARVDTAVNNHKPLVKALRECAWGHCHCHVFAAEIEADPDFECEHHRAQTLLAEIDKESAQAVIERGA